MLIVIPIRPVVQIQGVVLHDIVIPILVTHQFCGNPINNLQYPAHLFK